jgi:hypothetical protein
LPCNKDWVYKDIFNVSHRDYASSGGALFYDKHLCCSCGGLKLERKQKWLCQLLLCVNFWKQAFILGIKRVGGTLK